MCVDYSPTINIFNDLDEYPLLRTDDMMNELAKYSSFLTFGLRIAGHQIKIAESEQMTNFMTLPVFHWRLKMESQRFNALR